MPEVTATRTATTRTATTRTATTRTAAISTARPGGRVDPLRSHYFTLLVNNLVKAQFSEVSGLGVQVERIGYRDGGNNLAVRPIPGRVPYAPVTLKYGLACSAEMWDWLMSAVEGRVSRRNVSIALLDGNGSTEVLRWTLVNAWPQEWFGVPLERVSRELAIESLLLGHEGLRREINGAAAIAA